MAQAAAVVNVVSVLGSAYYTHKSIEAEKKAAKKANQAAQEQAQLERQNIEASFNEQQRKNRNLLAQQQSSYKARLGASGLTSKSGSGQVVLDKMKKDFDMEDKYRAAQKQYGLSKLNNNLKQINTRNLLTLEKLRNGQGQSLLSTAKTLSSMSSEE